MRKLIPLIASAMMMTGAPALAQHSDGEVELERAVAGRVAGEPVRCIALRGSTQSTIIDETAIVFRVGNTLYVNRPRNGAETLDRDDTLVHRQFGGTGQLCSVDTMRTVDIRTGVMTGLVFLGEFVPYRRVSSRY
jgi:hypothetical protein